MIRFYRTVKSVLVKSKVYCGWIYVCQNKIRSKIMQNINTKFNRKPSKCVGDEICKSLKGYAERYDLPFLSQFYANWAERVWHTSPPLLQSLTSLVPPVGHFMFPPSWFNSQFVQRYGGTLLWRQLCHNTRGHRCVIRSRPSYVIHFRSLVGEQTPDLFLRSVTYVKLSNRFGRVRHARTVVGN